MGRNLFAFPERLVDGQYETDEHDRFFDWRQHDLWSFLSGIESPTGIPAIAETRGIPPDGLRFEPFISEGIFSDMDHMSWLSVQELLAFDYDQTFVGTFRIIVDDDDGHFDYVPDPEAATEMTIRRFLGQGFFDELARLAASGADRIVFFSA